METFFGVFYRSTILNTLILCEKGGTF